MFQGCTGCSNIISVTYKLVGSGKQTILPTPNGPYPSMLGVQIRSLSTVDAEKNPAYYFSTQMLIYLSLSILADNEQTGY